VTVCADDFGMSSQICEAVVQLARQQALSATSCVVDTNTVESFAAPLLEVAADVSIGLHFNLTEVFANSADTKGDLHASLPRWWWRCYAGGANPIAVRREVQRQLDRFETLFARPPDFIDGHQHVHQLPVIRDQLIDEIMARYAGRIALRSTICRRPRGIKARIVQTLGGAELQAIASANAITTNLDFAGIYDFSAARPYADRMRSWLTSIADCGLIMCHPEHPGATTLHHAARAAEFDFLTSAAWRELLREQHIELIPFQADR
jgi:predicted glycoside hydrolase/deacetylase ChbG (UPF0249 family)